MSAPEYYRSPASKDMWMQLHYARMILMLMWTVSISTALITAAGTVRIIWKIWNTTDIAEMVLADPWKTTAIMVTVFLAIALATLSVAWRKRARALDIHNDHGDHYHHGHSESHIGARNH